MRKYPINYRESSIDYHWRIFQCNQKHERDAFECQKSGSRSGICPLILMIVCSLRCRLLARPAKRRRPRHRAQGNGKDIQKRNHEQEGCDKPETHEKSKMPSQIAQLLLKTKMLSVRSITREFKRKTETSPTENHPKTLHKGIWGIGGERWEG